MTIDRTACETDGQGAHVRAGERLLWDTQSAARLLSISHVQLMRAVYRGTIGSCKLGRRRLISARQLADYVERLERGDVA